jgi:hypothetical protein
VFSLFKVAAKTQIMDNPLPIAISVSVRASPNAQSVAPTDSQNKTAALRAAEIKKVVG